MVGCANPFNCSLFLCTVERPLPANDHSDSFHSVQGCDRYKYFGSLNQIQNQMRLVLLVLTDTKIQYHYGKMANFVSPNQIQIQIGLVLLVRPDTRDDTSQPCMFCQCPKFIYFSLSSSVVWSRRPASSAWKTATLPSFVSHDQRERTDGIRAKQS